MATQYGDRKAPTRADRGEWAPRIILTFIVLVVFAILIFDKASYIRGRWQGVILDWVGMISFIAGVIVLSGLGNWVLDMVYPKNNTDLYDLGKKPSFWKSVALAAGLIIAGLGLIYLFGSNL